ncbi:hypothetical protein BE221DRAFT_67217 [Ostreococcus tauri]|uniref:Peptidase S49 N-terminal proteobacteria domain-containing protein n=1 Tax=Ostreococcus tauri TaxID=70448 RepID=A0A1Y5IHH9_OSTTA|nr:hypothetical protein BE221DRAFT_67217 [Ostreococcus tauri]
MKPRSEPYLEIKRMNDKLDKYSLSFEAATVSEIQAERRRKTMEFSKKFSAALGSLTNEECDAIFEANKKWSMTDKGLMEQMNQLLAQIRAAAVESGGKRAKNQSESSGEESSETQSETNEGGFKNPFGGDKLAGLTKKLSKLATERAKAEEQYLAAVGAALPKSRRESLMKLLVDPRVISGWQNDTDVLAPNAETDENSRLNKKHVFVLNFFGDVRASQGEQLREEVTGLLRAAKKERGDEVATGETWFGKDALARNLVDNVQLKQPSPAATLFGAAGANASSWQWDILQRVALIVADYANSSARVQGVTQGPMIVDPSRVQDTVRIAAYDDETDYYVDRM